MQHSSLAGLAQVTNNAAAMVQWWKGCKRTIEKPKMKPRLGTQINSVHFRPRSLRIPAPQAPGPGSRRCAQCGTQVLRSSLAQHEARQMGWGASDFRPALMPLHGGGGGGLLIMLDLVYCGPPPSNSQRQRSRILNKDLAGSLGDLSIALVLPLLSLVLPDDLI